MKRTHGFTDDLQVTIPAAIILTLIAAVITWIAFGGHACLVF